MAGQRALEYVAPPREALLIAEAPGCHNCQGWKREGGNASAVGRCVDLRSHHTQALTSYLFHCELHAATVRV